ncbi:TetR family transcriptional regulator [Pseudoalteromonas sp. SCSIO_11900]|uniref:TetR/AcrR family transcriptional regulator n=1 Tax=Pseudoalteromonas TaxID=53246 RepID=UPI000449B927|nr:MULTISPECIES: TetR/AcrR family transcriptional regulator [Pseudoalteromonas]EWS98607.1 TetR family transcriptional regulator [Pseudoalteromonas sp. SCSIO_11900]MBT2151419.1 TetR/AcrR family transcriptional regulator [Pseudoalteromonas tetraodonis]MDX1726791.1 TetR/AcrR family transcriptional regulator [Pseudoalteromonas tetraodonis]
MTEKRVNNNTRQRGRPSRISRESIARVALDIGIQDATLVNIAKALQVDRSSLYHHVKSRKDVVSLATEIAVQELNWEAQEDATWREELIILTDALWQLYTQNPGLAEAVQQALVTPIEGIHGFAESVARLQQKGFALDDAVIAVDMLVDMVCDCFLGWWSNNKPDSKGKPRSERLIKLWQEQAKDHHHAEQINAMVAIMQAGQRLWWERKRDLVLDAIALRLSPS